MKLTIGTRWLICSMPLLMLTACSTTPKPSVYGEAPAPAKIEKVEKPEKAVKPPIARGGGYYQDDGPGDNPPPNIEAIPDAEPKPEAPHRYANDTYVVFHKTYSPLPAGAPYRASGIASWYGRKFHGQRTATGEIYDMYGMTAAHTTLAIPSYVRVTNLKNGKAVIVRVNDRGPFHSKRVIDLSYAAAYKLGFISAGSGLVEVESIDAVAWRKTHTVNSLARSESNADIATFWLQFGAFSLERNAEGMLGRLQSQLGQLGESVHIVAQEGLFRLRAGPFKTVAEANDLAGDVKRLTNVQAMVLR
jgi:rare lipoprotein A